MTRTWSFDEQRELRRHYSSTSDAELAKRIGVSLDDLRAEAHELGLRKNKAVFRGQGMPRWTREDVDILRKLYADANNLDVALRLGRSVKSIVSKANQLGLSKSEHRLARMGRENLLRRRDRQLKVS